MEEGYIKFRTDWIQEAPAFAEWQRLARARQRLYEQRLIGVYPDGIGFGNISCRDGGSDGFFITASATGHLPALQADHFALVTHVDIAANQIGCTGLMRASSESMSHAVIYQELPWVGGVAHGHDLALWQRLLWQLPTTPADIPYGSPEMAHSIRHLLRTTTLAATGVFVMAGHREGIFSFGKTVEEAVDKMISLW